MYLIDLKMSQTATPQKLVHLIDVIRPGGGPSGYLYNLHQAGELYGTENFVVRFDSCTIERVNSVFLKLRWPHVLARHLKPLKYIVLLLLGQKLLCEGESAKPDALVMVHTAPHAARILRKKQLNAKLIFMPHAPTSFTDEVMGEVDLRHGRSVFFGFYRNVLKRLELRLMSSSDLMVVAAREGVEAYFDGRGVPARELVEVTSGVPGFSASVDRTAARKALALPVGKLVVGYFGRYNQDKGYDFFRSEVSAMEQDDFVMFISAGVGVLAAEHSSNYKNFGWRSDVDVLMSACDVVVTPNKHTYFDLLPLEALSLSRPVFASRTGGNKRLAHLSDAVTLFDRQPGALAHVVRAYANMSPVARHQIEARARDSYERHFSQKAFWQAHVVLAEQILKRFNRGNRSEQ